MDVKAIVSQLRSAAIDDTKRSNTARLRELLDEVEAALQAGVRRATVVEILAANGIEFTLASFDSALRRLRKKRGKATGAPGKPVDARVSPPPKGETQQVAKADEQENEREAEAESPRIGSHNPADLDRIMRSRVDLEALAKHAKRKKN